MGTADPGMPTGVLTGSPGICKGPEPLTGQPAGQNRSATTVTTLLFPCDIICHPSPVVVQAGGKINETLREARVSSLLPAASSFSVEYLVLWGLAINAVGGDRATATSRVSVTTEKFNEQVPASPASLQPPPPHPLRRQ